MRHYGQMEPSAKLGVGPVPQGVLLEQPKNLFRYGEQTIYSSQMLQAGAIANSSFRLFATPQGQVGQGFTNALSISETNLKEGGRAPAGVGYDIFGVSAMVILASAANDTGTLNTAIDTQANVQSLLNQIQNGVLSWDFTQTLIDIAPMHLCGAGGGAFGSVGTGNAADVGHMNNGAGGIYLYRRHPVTLPATVTFSILLRYGSRAAAVANNSVVVKVSLFGFYKNVIEIG